MRRHVTSFAAPIIVRLFILSTDCCKILFYRTLARFMLFAGSRGKVHILVVVLSLTGLASL
ncbi:hypothetical protein HanIR_Chr03g0147871 [Helianthus annuus]|nr:hypothetical protein HanIR_Chr03g0147871 [Helianthus annuus]